jgi:hypothetical protein
VGDGVSEEPKPSEPQTITEMFHSVFPHYLAMGMSAEEYWDGPSGLVRDYREAFRIRMENEKAHWEEINDRAAWLHGVYMRHALSSVLLLVNGFVPSGAEPAEYPDRPYSEKAREEKQEDLRKQKEEREMQTAMAMMQARFIQFNKRFENQENA